MEGGGSRKKKEGMRKTYECAWAVSRWWGKPLKRGTWFPGLPHRVPLHLPLRSLCYLACHPRHHRRRNRLWASLASWLLRRKPLPRPTLRGAVESWTAGTMFPCRCWAMGRITGAVLVDGTRASASRARRGALLRTCWSSARSQWRQRGQGRVWAHGQEAPSGWDTCR